MEIYYMFIEVVALKQVKYTLQSRNPRAYSFISKIYVNICNLFFLEVMCLFHILSLDIAFIIILLLNLFLINFLDYSLYLFYPAPSPDTSVHLFC